jgi:hypothetical protein
MTKGVEELAKNLEKLGCPAGKSRIMAVQLERKARMDAERMGLSYEAAITRLTGLMAQGWAAIPKS